MGKGCVRVVLVHATFNHVVWDSRVLQIARSLMGWSFKAFPGTRTRKLTFKLNCYSNFARSSLVLVGHQSPATNRSLVHHAIWSSVIGHCRSQGLMRTNDEQCIIAITFQLQFEKMCIFWRSLLLLFTHSMNNFSVCRQAFFNITWY